MFAEELNVAGQAGVVRQQMAEADFSGVIARLAAHHEAGQPFANRIVEVQFATLYQQHGHGGGGCYFGEAGYIVDSVG